MRTSIENAWRRISGRSPKLFADASKEAFGCGSGDGVGGRERGRVGGEGRDPDARTLTPSCSRLAMFFKLQSS